MRAAQVLVTASSLVVIGVVIPWRDSADVVGLGRVRILDDCGESLKVRPIESNSGSAHIVARSDLKCLEPGLIGLLADLRPAYVLGYFCCMLVIAVCLSCRWRMLLRTGERPPPSLAWCFINWGRSQVISALPTSQVGGDAFRAQRTTLLGHSWIAACAIVALERLCGLAALCLVAVVGLAYSRSGESLRLLLAGTTVGIASALTWRIGRPVLRLIHEKPRSQFLGMVRLCTWLRAKGSVLRGGFQRHPKSIAGAFLLSGAAQVFSPLSFVLIDRALGLNTPAWCYLIAIPILAVAQYFPIHIAGIGLVEGGLWLTLNNWAGRTGAEIIALSAANRILGLLWLATLAVLFLVEVKEYSGDQPCNPSSISRKRNLRPPSDCPDDGLDTAGRPPKVPLSRVDRTVLAS